MRQQVVIQTENISRKGELKYFQIPLPGTAKRVIGVETSVYLLSQGLNPPTDPFNNGSGGSSGSGGSGSGNNNCPNPGSASIDPISNTVAGSVRTQIFQIGAAVNPNFIYQCGVYSVVLSITAVDGDTPGTIATKLADAVNNTSLATWNQFGSNNQNYKPTANSNADLLIVTTDNQHSFFASGSGSCGNQPPPPPEQPQYDMLFRIYNNEKAGTLSLQSPDATDIFLQAEVYRTDRNINYGDFVFNPVEMNEWIKGRKRISTDVLITTNSPILEAYYKDNWGVYYNSDVNYQLNIFIWIEKQGKQ